MTTPPPDKPADFTASDILAADAWTGRTPKPVLGMDVVCTKIAVDFQNMRRECDRGMPAAQSGAAARRERCRLRLPRCPRAPMSREFTEVQARAQRVRAVPPRGPERHPARSLPLAAHAALSICGSRSCATPRARARSRPQTAARFARAAHRFRAPGDPAHSGQAHRVPWTCAHAAARRLGREPAAADEAHRHEPRHRP